MERTVNERGDWAFEEPLLLNTIIQTRLLSSISVRTCLLRNGVTKLGRLLHKNGWRPVETLKVVTGLWSTCLISKLVAENFAVLLSSYRNVVVRRHLRGKGDEQDFPKFRISLDISEEQEEDSACSILSFKTPQLVEFEFTSKKALKYITVKVLHLNSLRQQRASIC